MPEKRRRQPLRFRLKAHALRAREIIGAAADLLVRVGCQSVRIDDVAAACGVAKGTCYQHFRSRTELVKAAVRELDAALAQHVLAAAAPARTGREQFRRAMFASVDAKLAALSRGKATRTGQSRQSPPPWPCCMGFAQCPYGGAVATTRALERLAEPLGQVTGEWNAVLVVVLLSLPQCLTLREGRQHANPEAVRAIVVELFDRLVESDASDTQS